MQINDAVIDKIEQQIENLLVGNQGEMEEAYLTAGDDPLDVGIKVKISPKDNKLKIKASISFVKSKCQDSNTSFVDQSQGVLFTAEVE